VEARVCSTLVPLVAGIGRRSLKGARRERVPGSRAQRRLTCPGAACAVPDACDSTVRMGDRSTMSSSVATNALVRTSRGSREHHLTKAMLENNMRVRSLQKTGRGGDHSGDHDQRSVRIGLEAALKNHVSVSDRMRAMGKLDTSASSPMKSLRTGGIGGAGRTGRLGSESSSKETNMSDFRNSMGGLCDPVFQRPLRPKKSLGGGLTTRANTKTKSVVDGLDLRTTYSPHHDRLQIGLNGIDVDSERRPERTSSPRARAPHAHRDSLREDTLEPEERPARSTRTGNKEMNRILEEAQRKLQQRSNPDSLFLRKGGAAMRTASNKQESPPDL